MERIKSVEIEMTRPSSPWFWVPGVLGYALLAFAKGYVGEWWWCAAYALITLGWSLPCFAAVRERRRFDALEAMVEEVNDRLAREASEEARH